MDKRLARVRMRHVQLQHRIAPKATGHKRNPIVTLLQQAYFSCPGKESTMETARCVLTGSFQGTGRRS